MKKYDIREPLRNEIPKCIEILYNAFDRKPPTDVKEEEKVWNALIDKEIGIFLTAEDEEKIVGIGGLFLFNNVCTYGYMAVLPEYRGKGIGTEIFKNLFEIANEMNYRTMILYASKLGLPIYKKFGFQERFYGIMYQLPNRLPDFQIQKKVVNVIEKIPEWVFTLDKKAMGFDRKRYLSMKVELGAKILAVEKEGYGFLVRDRLGPLIAKNEDAVLQIIKKSTVLGASHTIIANHSHLPKKFFQLVKLTKNHTEASLKMVYGKEIFENLNLLYSIGTYAKG